jgi:hypothetical protein
LSEQLIQEKDERIKLLESLLKTKNWYFLYENIFICNRNCE